MAVVGAVTVAAVGSAYVASESAKDAAEAQEDAATSAMSQEERMFSEIQESLRPYVDAGNQALGGYETLLGMNGFDDQQAAVDDLGNSALFQSLVAQGEQGLLANASATGGLRGGNTQAALAQFRPQMLNQQVQQQMGHLGNLANMGQNAAAQTGQFGQTASGRISNLHTNIGQANAGSSLAQGSAWSNAFNTIGGAFAGMPTGGYGGGGGGGGGGTYIWDTPDYSDWGY